MASIFITQDSHYVPSASIRDETLPADVRITKAFSKSKVTNIIEHSKSLKRDDPTAADKWLAALQNETEALSTAVAAWEKWESRGGLRKVNARKKTLHAVKQLHPATRSLRLRDDISRAGSDSASPSSTSPLPSAGTASSMIFSAIPSSSFPWLQS